MRLTIIGSILAAVVVVALVVTISGCGGGGAGGDSSISGYVRDAGSLQPIQNAQVSGGGRTVSTDATGFFLLDPAPSNAVMLAVTAPGYLSQTYQAPAGNTLRYLPTPVYLVPAPVDNTGNISGVITQAGQLQSGAQVNAGGRQAISRNDGTYFLYNVPQGFQTVFATSADGLTGGSANTTVITHATAFVNIQLSTQPPPPPISD